MTSANQTVSSVPDFPPVPQPRGRHRRRLLRRRRRPFAASLAITAAALAAAVPRGEARPERPGAPAAGASEGPDRGQGQEPDPPVAAPVLMPVRIADPAAARLLRPGDEVDVLATPTPRAAGGRTAPARARVVARHARVAELPGGSLLVLAVTPRVAAELAAAAATSELAVAQW